MNLHPLLERLCSHAGATALAPDAVEAFLASAGRHVLLFAGDPVRFPEALDVAVVLPELRAALGRPGAPPCFDIGLLAREHEDALARRYGVQRWPSLLFVQGDGERTQRLGTVSGMHDWPEYLQAVRDALGAVPGRFPGVGIPLVASGAAEGAAACH